jgi:ELWxxDGT repeat protein
MQTHVNVNGRLFFDASDGSHGVELWESDGTSAGTVMVQDINPGSHASSPRYLTNVSGTLFFGANDGSHGYELWAFVPPPTPTLNGLSQSTAAEASAAFTLMLTGSNFDSTATVLFNGTPLATTLVSATQLQARVPASLVAEEGSATVSVTEDNGTSSGLPLTITDAPLGTLSLNAPSGLTEGKSTGTFTVATFTDANTGAPATDFTATVTWGDGTSGTASVVKTAPGSFAVRAAHAFAEEGSGLSLSVAIADDGSSISGVSSTFTVADYPLTSLSIHNPAATEGKGTNLLTVATFVDNTLALPTDFTATITWGDGTTTTVSGGAFVKQSGGGFALQAAHTYAEEGSFTLSVQILDDGGASVSGSRTLSVAEAGLFNLGLINPHQTEGRNTGTVATFFDKNAGAAATDFTATIAWGDGSTTTLSGAAGNIVALGGGTFALKASHTYADEGSDILSVQIRDDGGASLSGSLTVSVADAVLGSLVLTKIQGTEGKNTGTLKVASFHDTNSGAPAADFTAAIAWGDGTTTTVSGGGLVALGNGNFAVNASHTYAEEGTYTLSVQILDDGGASLSASRTVGVADARLFNPGLFNPHTTEGQGTGTFTVATFADLNAAALATDFTATIAWGDGSTTTLSGAAGNIVALGGGQFALRAGHTYAEEGSFTLSVQVLDDGGATLSSSLTLTVADARLTSLSVQNPHATAGRDTGTFTVATFHDNNLFAPTTDFTAIINWGDGSTSTLPSSDFVSEGNGNFAVLADHLFATSGSFTLSVLIDDTGGASVSGTLKISVT